MLNHLNTKTITVLISTKKPINLNLKCWLSQLLMVSMIGLSGVSTATAAATALHDAAQTGNTAQLQAAVQQNLKQLNESDAKGNTPLMLASQAGQTDAVALLIKNQSNLDLQNKQGQTALLLAIDHQKIAIAELLIKAGANVKLADANELSPLKLAIAINQPTLIQLLGNKGAAKELTKSQQFDLMAVSITLAQPETLSSLLKLGLNAKELSSDKMTLLMVVPMGYISQKKVLLEKKLPTTQLLNQYNIIVDTLIAAGTDLVAKDADGLTALDYVMGISAQASKENSAYTMNELFNLMQKKGVK